VSGRLCFRPDSRKVCNTGWATYPSMRCITPHRKEGISTGMAMDAARQYVGGDQHCGRTRFRRYDPKLFIGGGLLFFPSSWYRTCLLSRFRFIIQFIL